LLSACQLISESRNLAFDIRNICLPLFFDKNMPTANLLEFLDNLTDLCCELNSIPSLWCPLTLDFRQAR
jgi:hypothetical protein